MRRTSGLGTHNKPILSAFKKRDSGFTRTQKQGYFQQTSTNFNGFAARAKEAQEDRLYETVTDGFMKN